MALLDYKIVVVKNLIKKHQDWKRAVPTSIPSKKQYQSDSIDNHGGHCKNDAKKMRLLCNGG